MKKLLLALGAAMAALGLFAQVSTADAHLLGRRSPSVTAAQLTVGIASTATFWALTHRHHHHVHIGGRTFWKWYGLTTVGCMALTPMVGAALVGHNEHRELRSSEVFMMLGDCVVPILGGLFWQAMFDAHPEWDRGTGRPTRR
jgi:fucose permease